MSGKFQVIFINQVAGPLFQELVEDTVNALGPCLLITGKDNFNADINSDILSTNLGPAYNRFSIFSRLFSWASFFFYAFIVIGRSDKKSLLFFVSNPPFLPLLGWLFSFLRGQPYVLLVYDLYPKLLVGLKRIPENGLLSRLWSAFNRMAWRRASAIFTIGDHMAKNVSNELLHLKIKPPVITIPNWADGEKIYPLMKSENWFSQMYNQQDQLTVMYSGNIGETHDLSPLLDAAKILEEEKIHFLVIGGGTRWESFKSKARHLKNMTVLPFQPEKDLPFTLTTADVSVVTLEPGVEGCSVPSKTYYALASGAALLVLSRGPNELIELVEQSNCGLYVEHGPQAAQEIIRAIRHFYQDVDFLMSCKRNARVAMEKYYSRENTQQYIELLSGILKGGEQRVNF